MKNKYVEHAHIPERKVREIIRCFAVDLDASQIARLTGISRNTVNRYLKALRQRLVEYCNEENPVALADCDDEESLGVRRLKTNLRGCSGKSIVFGIFQNNGRIYTEIVPECVRAPLQALVRGRVNLRNVIDIDDWRGYSGLVDVACGRHLRVDFGRDEENAGGRGRLQINGIEGFWGYAKGRLVRLRGMKPETFNLHLKEYEFRYNHKGQDLYPLLLKIVRNQPLKLT